ncbi:MAG TPA: hypothetical protein VLD67_17775, partial [Vicinamibacterales bacterium]|nr:hypothetical protein [Vicinamibacterales bacterium]
MGTAFGLSVGLPLVLSRRAAPTADRLFGALATTAALTLALIAAERSGLTASVPALDRLDFVLALIAGPLLYLYARTVARPERTLQQSDLVHGLPALALLGALGAWSSALVAWKPPFPAVLVIQM